MPDKHCVICGKDCADSPRVKDPKGHYFCKRCYDAAIEKRRIDQEVATTTLDDLDAPILEVASSHGCPGCGAVMADAAAVCMSCGYNRQMGGQIHVDTSPMAPPVMGAGVATASQSVWPVIVGVISILMGAGGVVLNGINSVGLAVSGKTGNPSGIGEIVGGVIAALLALWLLLAAIGIVRRQQAAVESIRKWAWVKVVLGATCIGFMAIGLAAVGASGGPTNQSGTTALIMSGGVVMIVLLAFWTLSWPVFILIWTGRASIQQDVGSW